MEDWQRIYNLTPGYLFTFSHDGLIVNMNSLLLNDLGYQYNEVTNTFKLEQLLTAGSSIFFQTHLFPLIKGQESAKELYLIFKTKDNRKLPVLLNAVLEKTGDDFVVYCAGMEISNRNQFEKELYEAKNLAEKAQFENRDLIKLKKELQLNQHVLEKQLQQLTRFNYEHQQINKVLSHDLQEPLRKIVLFISLIEGILDDGHPVYPYFQKIKGFTSRVRKLINSMQRYNSLDTKDITHSDVDLNDVISRIKNKMGCNSTSITYSSTDNFKLKADAALINNLFEELITNSCKFKHPEREPEITITTDVVLNNIFKFTENRYKYENFIRIRYTDNGMGFDNTYSKQIFELFRKLHENEGIGIGLPYCKKIIDMHHGTITVQSSENVGTKFSILLPVEPVYNLVQHLSLIEN